MNTLKITVVLSLLALISCKDKEKKEEKEPGTEKVETVVSSKPVYAEISIKEGGQWQDGPRDHKEYVGGTFKNVNSLEVPEEHTDHTWYIRYEGPGWENKNVGYRLYLDWRNAIDVWGKKVDSLVLPYVGQDGFDSYHEPADWGMDVLKVAQGLGVGSYGRQVEGTTHHFNVVANTSAQVENTDNEARVTINYKGWETPGATIDLQSELSMYPEGRYMKAVLKPSEKVEGLCTGIVKFDNIDFLQKEGEQWGYIATYGKQSLSGNDDDLGMAVFYKLSETAETTKGEHDHLVIFKPADTVTYYLLAAWDQEKDGITTREGFTTHLNELLTQLDSEGKLE
ncbi:DUF4861 domain-containing protein [Sinomicrobium pectinilyticum]|uniref:DUF4861 domain-containing protein n=1 Tax=Sinomicrobium pectinilyticum TaxID=1084421 RepID=A0A3N0E5G1_SINP1|nr:DUF4861 family protein [Sinomicrobium pectinilyticum]RNL83080.1 DUF4861 domain-containing protein [Sinomicrobium pectinilyticum]